MSAQTQASSQPNLGMQVTTFENPMGIDGFEFDARHAFARHDAHPAVTGARLDRVATRDLSRKSGLVGVH